ncbi:MAG TPA: 3-phosphoshikimate 1-carboxyvinyltransferase, partial [Acidimicrobiia bacterium]|nr:3-phosphoshikimate 1-carboxyvinyltransferase [Acidimicrobiia bacterium]
MTPAELAVEGPAPLRGRLRPPGDKGISHRALLFAAMADGTSHLTRLADG